MWLSVLGVLTLMQAGCIYTVPFRNEDGEVLPGSIAVMERVEIGGISQMLWIRGTDTDNPALILLHGGPGASEMPLFRHYNAGLEHHFLVVYWEQRGTGRSFSSDIPPETMTVSRMVEDLAEIVKLVKQRFDKRRVVLLGHSWGSVLGTIYTSRYSDDVAAYVGTGQVVHGLEGERLSYRYALDQARRRDDERAIAELTEIGPPPYGVKQDLTLGRWLERFGGEYHGDLSKSRLILAALGTTETNLLDLVKFGRGNAFSLQHLHDEVSRIDFTRDVPALEVPVLLLLGRHDWNTPSVLAARWLDRLEAPSKKLVWFEASAHNPPFEEPERFNRVMIDQVRPLASR